MSNLVRSGAGDETAASDVDAAAAAVAAVDAGDAAGSANDATGSADDAAGSAGDTAGSACVATGSAGDAAGSAGNAAGSAGNAAGGAVDKEIAEGAAAGCPGVRDIEEDCVSNPDTPPGVPTAERRLSDGVATCDAADDVDATSAASVR